MDIEIKRNFEFFVLICWASIAGMGKPVSVNSYFIFVYIYKAGELGPLFSINAAAAPQFHIALVETEEKFIFVAQYPSR